MADLEPTGSKQASKAPSGRLGRWGKGISGNPSGRPVGSRNRLAEGFLEAMRRDFEKNGEAAIEAMRNADPGGYVRSIVAILPKEMDLAGEGGGPIKLVISWERS
jgi:hypothetical protein